MQRTQQRHKTRAGVPDEEKDKSRMGGENREEKGRRISEDVWSEDEFNKVQLTAGGLKVTHRL